MERIGKQNIYCIFLKREVDIIHFSSTFRISLMRELNRFFSPNQVHCHYSLSTLALKVVLVCVNLFYHVRF